jgi:hypothetical protein
MLIPVAANNGEVFSASHHAAFEFKACDALGGFTLYPATAVGGWINGDGKAYADATRVYGFALRSLAQGSALVELARFAAEHYGQEAIAIRYLGQFEIIS